jgi:putative FmdB family regulatory protein
MSNLDIIVVGSITDPGHDYICEECDQLLDVRYRRDEKPVAVTCPICGSGNTHKLISAPAVKIWWKNAAASNDSSEMTPKYRPPIRNRAAQGGQ